MVFGLVFTCKGGDNNKAGGIWLDALPGEPLTLVPSYPTNDSSSELISQMFETLVEYNDKGKISPLLAKKWSISEDGLVYTFHLQEDVYFHDKTEKGTKTANGGRKVVAQDWVWTFNYIAKNDELSGNENIEMIKGYEDVKNRKEEKLDGVYASDEYTLKIELKDPFAPFLSILTDNKFSVIPEEDVKKWKDEWRFHPVGTGPFKFKSWSKDSRIELIKNDKYWKTDKDGYQLPYLEQLNYRIITDRLDEWILYEKGEIYQTAVPDVFYQEAIKREKYYEKPLPGIYFYGMNIERKPFDSEKVRKAMNYALNRKELIELVFNGRVKEAKGIIPPGMLGHNSELKFYEYNPEKAKKLLEEAGYEEGVEVTLHYDNDKINRKIANVLQSQYRKSDIHINLEEKEWEEYLELIENGEVSLFKMTWINDYYDPDNLLYTLLNSNKIDCSQGNYFQFKDRIFDKWTRLGREIGYNDLREEAYQEANKIAIEKAPWVFLYHLTTHSLVKPYVMDYYLPAKGQYFNKFREVWLDK